MIEVNFSLKNCNSEPAAHTLFWSAMKLLDQYKIPYSQAIDDELFCDGDYRMRSKRTFYTVYKIYFEKEEDYLAYMLIKD